MPGPYYVIPKGGAFSFIEKAVKGVARSVVPGFSAVEGGVRALTNKPKRAAASIQGPTILTAGGTTATLGMINLPGGIGLSLPGFGSSGPNPSPTQGKCPPGYHLDKATGTKCVRNRHTNFGNGRATARAVRRLKGAEKQFKKVLRVLGKPQGRVVPKGRAKR